MVREFRSKFESPALQEPLTRTAYHGKGVLVLVQCAGEQRGWPGDIPHPCGEVIPSGLRTSH